MIDLENPTHQGIPVGAVTAVDGRCVTLRAACPLERFDGLCFVRPASDLLGRYENLRDDLARILKQIGIEDAAPLPELNVYGSGGDYRKFYTDNTRKLVEEWYAPEIKTFGYKF